MAENISIPMSQLAAMLWNLLINITCVDWTRTILGTRFSVTVYNSKSLEELTMKLFLVQHGDALAKEVDPDRPLSDKGQQDVNKVASFLRASSISVRQILHSGKTRAMQTAEIFANLLDVPAPPEKTYGIQPNDPVDAFATRVLEINGDTMIVGHLPFMNKLVSYLLSKDEQRNSVSFEPGSVICLEKNEQNNWTLLWMIRPHLL